MVDPTLDAEREQTGDSGDETSTLTDPELADPAGETPADSTAADGSVKRGGQFLRQLGL